jgi:AcrR family transcriptional regulator
MTASHTAIKARGTGRPSRDEAARIEGQIVDIARDLFFAHGYGATSIEMIARKASISKRTFYHRFPNKAAVFRAVVNRLIQEVTPGNVEGLFEGRSIEEILNGLAMAILSASLSQQTLALNRLVMAETERFPELAMVMSEQGARRDALVRITALLQGEQTAGRARLFDPEIAAELFMHMVIAGPQRRAFGLGKPMTPVELTRWAATAVTIFLDGFSTSS